MTTGSSVAVPHSNPPRTSNLSEQVAPPVEPSVDVDNPREKKRKRKASDPQRSKDQVEASVLKEKKRNKKRSRRGEDGSDNTAEETVGGDVERRYRDVLKEGAESQGVKHTEGKKKRSKQDADAASGKPSEAQVGRKRQSGGERAEGNVIGDGQQEVKEKKKRKKSVSVDEESAVLEMGPTAKMKFKDNGAKTAGPDHGIRGAKKRKNKKASLQITADSPIAGEPEKEKPGRKRPTSEDGKRTKRSSKTHSSPYPDPSEDTSLSDQSRKALAYAYTQSVDSSSWKFSKARQNWLVRNHWSEEAIPDNYLLLVHGYLGKVQGGVRETLIQTCRSALSSTITSSSPASVDAPSANSNIPEAGAADTTKRNRAKQLLAILAGELTS